MRSLLILAGLAAASAVQAQESGSSVVLANDKLEVTLLKQGATIASIVLKSDSAKLNPLWAPEQKNFGGYGHFVCVDGFGGTSRDEAAAGLPGHGEAIRTQFEVIGPQTGSDGIVSVTFTAALPLVQERLIRTYSLRPGDSALAVRTRLESLVAFDRPISWAEHGTIGSPFLERGVTVVDQSGKQSRTRPYDAEAKGRRSLASGVDFAWPNAPLAAGSSVNLRAAPANGAMDHTTTAQDMKGSIAWATALNPRLGRIVGWVWRPADYPWLQNWQNYPEKGVLARGLEFSTQPWDIPRKEAVAIGSMMGNPAFRWLPAKGAIETVFMLFYSAVPSNLTQVSSLEPDGESLLLNDRVRIAAPPAMQ